jgi:serine/threonine protein kinase
MSDSEIFKGAVKLPPDRRQEYLDQACGANPELRREVESLLREHDASDSFLERPAAEFIPTHAFGHAFGETVKDAEHALDFLVPSDTSDCLGKIGQYEVTEVVGRGGMGIVLKGNDPKLNRVVAVKVLAPELASNASARKRFLREGRAAAAVSHDHVVTIYGIDDAGPLPLIAMEYISGPSLEGRIQEAGSLELAEILRIGMQIASGLSAAHAQGLVHRDVKPANILLENGVEKVKITDFGLARAVDDVRMTRPGVVTGTPEYMSPEQARGESVDHRTDLFSLGSVLYAMCTGRSPFRAENTVGMIRRVCEDTPRPIEDVNPETPGWLAQIVERLLAKEPDARFQSADEVADLLGRHLAHLQQPSLAAKPELLPPLARPRKQARGGNRSRWPVAAAAAVLLLVGFGLTEATGVTNVAEFVSNILRIETRHGTLVVKIDDPNIKVTVDENGETITLTGIGEHEIKLRPGRHAFEAAKAGRVFKSDLLTITRGGREVVNLGPEPYQPTPGAVDMLALIDPARDTRWGEWKLHDDILINWGSSSSICMPYLLPEEYDIIVTVKRLAGESFLMLPVWVQGKRCWPTIDGWGDSVDAPEHEWFSGIIYPEDASAAKAKGWIEGYRGELLPLNQETTIRCAVREKEGKPSIHVVCNGTTAIDWKGTPEEVATWADQAWRLRPKQIGGVWIVGKKGAFHITRLEVVPHGDGGRALFSDPSGRPDQLVADRIFWYKGGTVWGSVDGAQPVKFEGLNQLSLPPSCALTRIDVKQFVPQSSSRLLATEFCLERLTSLEALSLRGQRKVPATVLDSIGGCSSLRELDLGFTDVNDEGLEKLKGLAELRRLVLTGTAISDAGCAHLRRLTKLEELELCGTSISNDGLKGLRELQGLRRLDLDNTSIDDRGLAQLGHLPKLASLSLAYTGVSKDGLATLRGLKSLADVSLIGAQVTDDALKNLAKHLPDCRIQHDAGSPVDLLKIIDAERDSVNGIWERDGDILVSPASEGGTLQIPYVPPEEYSIQAVVNRQSGSFSVRLGVVQQGRQTAVSIDRWAGDPASAYLDYADGTYSKGDAPIADSNLLTEGQDVPMRVTVRKGRITATCADRLILDWSGDPGQLRRVAGVPKQDVLFLSAHKSRFRFSQLRLTPISRIGPAPGQRK